MSACVAGCTSYLTGIDFDFRTIAQKAVDEQGDYNLTTIRSAAVGNGANNPITFEDVKNILTQVFQ